MRKVVSMLALASVFACSRPLEQPPSIVQQSDTSATITARVPGEPLPPGVVLEDFGDRLDIRRAVARGTEGNFRTEGTYRNDKREGAWIEYHPNGRVRTVTGFVDGKKEGLHMEFNEHGQTLLTCTYHNNMRHGVYKTWNGTVLKEIKTYNGDKVEGLAKAYYDDGTLQEEGKYVNGQREGVSRWYDSKGKLSIEYEYRNGELVKK
jgi:antitoxin component YwqK of YwqJK toxin-antitoxin module